MILRYLRRGQVKYDDDDDDDDLKEVETPNQPRQRKEVSFSIIYIRQREAKMSSIEDDTTT